ncbi:hypothetical protein [Spirosoma panaciterrae]|uniref:hypothetical protein n=1 Tax=Spirosoma panaciterrae TaxID=496058 RepID=UPI0004755460|nr:hypothetical protein [Spirosoma panaciterrae]
MTYLLIKGKKLIWVILLMMPLISYCQTFFFGKTVETGFEPVGTDTKDYFIPISYRGGPLGASGEKITVSVDPTSTANSAGATPDYTINITSPQQLQFLQNTPNTQYIHIILRDNNTVANDQTIILTIALVPGGAAGASIDILKQTYTMTIKDNKQETDDNSLPLGISLGTNLNVIGKNADNPNIYFDLVWIQNKATTYSKKYDFGGYIRVFQQQSTSSLSEQGLNIFQQATLYQPVYKVMGGVTISQTNNIQDTTVKVQRETIRLAPHAPIVKSTGLVLGGTFHSFKGDNPDFKASVSGHLEIIKRDITFGYTKTSVIKDTVIIKYRQFIQMPDSSTTRQRTYVDVYLGFGFPINYKYKSLEVRAIPSFGLTGLGLSGLKSNKSFYGSIYVLLMERKYGLSVGCDVRALPFNNAIVNFNIFASKVFALDKVAEALSLK